MQRFFPVSLGALMMVAAMGRAAGPAPPPVTFEKDVLPILQRNCQSCHRPGQVAPMSFLTYESTRPWAKAIKLAVLTHQMPPWPPDPRYGHFRNERHLEPEEIRTLIAWVDGGAVRGEDRQRAAPEAPTDGWSIPPDVVITLPKPIPIPAKGTVELTDIQIPTGFSSDTWVTSIEIRPGNRSVVHHVILCVAPHDEDAVLNVPHALTTKRDAEGVALARIPSNQRLRDPALIEAVYVPGIAPMDYRPYQAAKLIPAKSDLWLQIHYTPNGSATTDQTQIGFTLAKGKPTHRFVTVNPTALRDAAHFRIPAGDPNWETRTEVVFNQDAELVWFLPHMHLRGKDMTYRLSYPGGESQTILSVKYNFNWQFSYEPMEPMPVPKGTKLEVTAHFDNSANNPLNPNPNRDVRWGDQTWEEMMVPWFGVLIDATGNPKNVVSYTPDFSGCPPRMGKKEGKACREVWIAK
jgi:hypothetical protein